jgi:hypothetical protein
VVITALVITAVVIGGYTRVGRQSGPYDAALNRSFAAQGAVVADQSDVTASALQRLLRQMHSQDRPDLEAALDSVVEQTGQQAAQAALVDDPGSPEGVQGNFAAVFADRAAAVRQVRTTLDGLLGMSPLAVAGTTGGAVSLASAPTLLSSAEATDRIAAAGELLTRADRLYTSVRHTLSGLAGHARLPRSRWISPAGARLWQTAALTSQVDELTVSPSLAVTHLLVLRTVQLTPAALPTPSRPQSAPSVVSPTHKLDVEVVLSDLGTVAEPHATVQFSLVPQPTGVTATKSRSAALAPGGSVSLAPASFAVKPGHAYQLVVAIVLPAGQSVTGGTSLTRDLQIAPNT